MHRTDITPTPHPASTGAAHGQITALGHAIKGYGLPFIMLGGLPGTPIKLSPALCAAPAANT